MFSRNLRRVCRFKKLDAAALANRLGRSRRSTELLLTGETTPGLAIITTIARKLKVPLADLVRGL